MLKYCAMPSCSFVICFFREGMCIQSNNYLFGITVKLNILKHRRRKWGRRGRARGPNILAVLGPRFLNTRVVCFITQTQKMANRVYSLFRIKEHCTWNTLTLISNAPIFNLTLYD